MDLSISYYVTPSKKDYWPITANLSFRQKVFNPLKGKQNYKKKKFALGVYVHKDDWDNEAKVPTSRGKLSEVGSIETRIRGIFDYLVREKKFSADTFMAELAYNIRGEQKLEVVKRVRFVDFIQEEIKSMPSLSSRTKNNYDDLSTKLVLFEDKVLGRPLYSDEFNEQVYCLFMEMIRGEESIRKINTVWSLFKNLRSVINKINHKYDLNVFTISSASKDEQVKAEVPEKPFLSWEQIQKVINYKPTEPDMKNIKVMFLTLVFSGCRIGDIYKVVPEYTYNEKGIKFQYARFITDKGKGTEVIIPILKPLQDAIKENGGQTATRMTESMFNEKVKDLMKAAGFTEVEKFSYTDKHNRLKFETAPLYQFISSHTGRRSFITNLINFIPEPMLSKITAHKINDDRRVMYSYNKISLLQNAAYFVRELKRLRQAYAESVLFDLM